MPLFAYKCEDCSFKKEHFVYPDKTFTKPCPQCGSDKYVRRFGSFKLSIESSDPAAYEKKISKGVNEIYADIGKEGLNQDTKTMENMFGAEKVKATYHEADD